VAPRRRRAVLTRAAAVPERARPAARPPRRRAARRLALAQACRRAAAPRLHTGLQRAARLPALRRPVGLQWQALARMIRCAATDPRCAAPRQEAVLERVPSCLAARPEAAPQPFLQRAIRRAQAAPPWPAGAEQGRRPVRCRTVAPMIRLAWNAPCPTAGRRRQAALLQGMALLQEERRSLTRLHSPQLQPPWACLGTGWTFDVFYPTGWPRRFGIYLACLRIYSWRMTASPLYQPT
jgi:hypothetical protein